MGSWPGTRPRPRPSSRSSHLFTGVEILEAGMVETSDGVSEVAVLVRATDGAGRAQVLEYGLVVEQRDGRWEVSHLLAVPPLASSETN